MKHLVIRFLREDQGEDLIEYGLLQVSTPTVEESAEAAVLMDEVFDRLTSTVAEPAIA